MAKSILNRQIKFSIIESIQIINIPLSFIDPCSSFDLLSKVVPGEPIPVSQTNLSDSVVDSLEIQALHSVGFL